eukprot:g4121.t1
MKNSSGPPPLPNRSHVPTRSQRMSLRLPNAVIEEDSSSSGQKKRESVVDLQKGMKVTKSKETQEKPKKEKRRSQMQTMIDLEKNIRSKHKTALAKTKSGRIENTLRYTVFAYTLAHGTAMSCALNGLINFVYGCVGYKDHVMLEVPAWSFLLGIYQFSLCPLILLYEHQFGLQGEGPESFVHKFVPVSISAAGTLYFLLGIPLISTIPSAFTFFGMMCTSLCYFIARHQGEVGNSSRLKYPLYTIFTCGSVTLFGLFKKLKVKYPRWDSYEADDDEKEASETRMSFVIQLQKYTFGLLNYVYLRGREDPARVGKWVLVGSYTLMNIILFIHRYYEIKGVLDLVAEEGEQTMSAFAPFAKGFGQLLNFNCSLILYPVLRGIIRYLNLFDTPSKALPLQKHIDFHKLIGSTIYFAAIMHTLAHFLNYALTPEQVSNTFILWYWVSGGIILIAMFIIFAGAQDMVKRANYRFFWLSHHFFMIFFCFLVGHGRVFYQWFAIPFLLYMIERLTRVQRGNHEFVVKEVRWHKPVMEVRFAPLYRSHFNFKEGQYVHLLCPTVSQREWHPFTISSCVGDLDKDMFVSVHIRVIPGGWTEKVKNYFAVLGNYDEDMNDFNLKLTRYDVRSAKTYPGKLNGLDGLRLLKVDGPHAAPAQHYDEYRTMMIIGAGIGLTPCASILRATLRYRWKQGFAPETLNFYWIVRHSEIRSFSWFVKLLWELERDVSSYRKSGMVDEKLQKVSINIYVTRAPKKPEVLDVKDITKHLSARRVRGKESIAGEDIALEFSLEKLFHELLNPKVSSKEQKATTVAYSDINVLQDIKIWNGRPQWGQIFEGVYEVASRRYDDDISQETKIGVAFCGAPIIGRDLSKQCDKYSSIENSVYFHLHKENF